MNVSIAILVQQLTAYAKPDPLRSWMRLGADVTTLCAIWSIGFATVEQHPWVVVLVTPLAVGFLARLFAVFHDCGHGSYFGSRRANDLVGKLLGVILLTPFGLWRNTHQRHHATAGDLDRRGVGDIETLTVDEYRSLTPRGRLRYRLYRSPAVFLLVGPIYLFLIRYRIPTSMPEPRTRMIASVVLNDLSLAAVFLLGSTAFGARTFLLTVVPSLAGMAAAALWVFYVQHQFHSTQWVRSERWSFSDAALHGSAFYDLPTTLRWLTGNIGIHHIHHLCTRIPGYRLMEVLRDHPELARLNRVGVRSSVACARLALWDERAGRLVTFSEAGFGRHPLSSSRRSPESMR